VASDPGPVLSTARAFNSFGAELFARLRGAMPGKNLVVSPFNVATALALTLAGASGETAAQIATALRLDLEDVALHDHFPQLLRELGGHELLTAARMWGSLELDAEPEFLSIARNDYGSPFDTMDVRRPEEVSAQMNAWVKEQTAGRVSDLVSPSSIRPDTRLVLIAALYFKASWLEPFSRSNTGQARFTRRDGSRIEIPMMNLEAPLGHAITASAEVVELRFLSPSHVTTKGRTSAERAGREREGPRFSMLLALPKSRLEEVPFDEISRISTVRPGPHGSWNPEVSLSVPRFKIDSRFDLIADLAAMGMLDMASTSADFSRITDSEALWLDEVTHQAIIDVDEEGATAAAATMIRGAPLDASVTPPPIVVRFDRPFLFLLRENRSGAVLIAGWVEDPSLLV